MSNNEIKKFVEDELKSLCTNISLNYKENMEKRKDNPFLPLDDNIQKYMALGRSMDSQLGNRIQRIIFLLSRYKYDDISVPNFTSIKMEKDEIILTLYSIPTNLEAKYQNKNFNPFIQYVYINKNLSEEKIKKRLHIKAKYNNLETQTFKFKISSNTKFKETYSEFSNKCYPVDLIIFSISKNANGKSFINGVNAYEIKMGGNLDTKNAKSNALEVLKNKKVFDFIESNKSSFATCYGKCSDAIKKELNEQKLGLKKPNDFWNCILPDSLSYSEFIEIYGKAFEDAKIKDTLCDL